VSGDEWTREQETAQRRRAAWGLGILALVAAIVVSLMAFFMGTSDGGNNALPPAPSVPLTTDHASPPPSSDSHRATSSNSANPPSSHTQSSPATSHQRHHRNQPSVPPTGGQVSCPSGNPCVAPGDIGHVMGALNEYRAAHGRAPADGTVTAAAQRCALGNGDGSACPSSYFWEPVTGRDGQGVINKIADGGDGISFLLDPKATFQVGWAYEPAAHTYECALVTG